MGPAFLNGTSLPHVSLVLLGKTGKVIWSAPYGIGYLWPYSLEGIHSTFFSAQVAPRCEVSDQPLSPSKFFCESLFFLPTRLVTAAPRYYIEIKRR